MQCGVEWKHNWIQHKKVGPAAIFRPQHTKSQKKAMNLCGWKGESWEQQERLGFSLDLGLVWQVLEMETLSLYVLSQIFCVSNKVKIDLLLSLYYYTSTLDLSNHPTKIYRHLYTVIIKRLLWILDFLLALQFSSSFFNEYGHPTPLKYGLRVGSLILYCGKSMRDFFFRTKEYLWLYLR